MTSQIRVDEITNRSGLGTVTIYDNGFEFTGVTTFTEDVDITGGLTIGGVLTYEDVTNIDSVGLITARNGLHVTSGNVAIGHNNPLNTLHVKGPTGGVSARFTDAVNATVLVSHPSSGKSKIADAGGNYGFEFDTASVNILSGGSERLRITSGGNVDIGGATHSRNLTVHDATNSVILIEGASNGTSNLMFADENDEDVGMLGYNHASNYLAFTVNAAERLRIASDGKIHIGGNGTGTDQFNLIAAGGGINISRLNAGSPSVNEWLGALGFKGYATGNSTAGADARIHANAAFNHSGTSAPANLIFSTKGTTEGPGNAPVERMRLTHDGKVGINETSPTALLDINHPNTEQGLKVRSRYGNISTAMVKFDADPDSDGGDGNVLHLHGGSSRTDSEILHVNSTGEGTCFQIRGDGRTRVYKQLELQHASNVPKIIFNEYGANDIKAQIEMDQISGSAGQLVFRTQDSGTLSERMRLLAGGGLTFNGDTSAYNALDDYEEGTWTPTCASASSVSYQSQYGRYTKVGNCITIWWDLIWTSLSGGNNARIGGLPYTPVVNTNKGGYGIPAFRDASGTNSDNRIYGNSSYFASSGIYLQHYNSSGNATAGSFNGSGRITGWGQYFDNSPP